MSEQSAQNLTLSRLISRFGELALKPVDAFAAGTEMFAQAARGVYDLAGEGYDTVTSQLTRTLDPAAVGGPAVDLDDPLVKLVEYSVVSIEPDRERVLESDQVLVAEPMGRAAFEAWRIADYLQRGGKKKIPPAEREFLRVCYQVIDRWPAEED